MIYITMLIGVSAYANPMLFDRLRETNELRGKYVELGMQGQTVAPYLHSENRSVRESSVVCVFCAFYCSDCTTVG